MASVLSLGAGRPAGNVDLRKIGILLDLYLISLFLHDAGQGEDQGRIPVDGHFV